VPGEANATISGGQSLIEHFAPILRFNLEEEFAQPYPVEPTLRHAGTDPSEILQTRQDRISGEINSFLDLSAFDTDAPGYSSVRTQPVIYASVLSEKGDYADELAINYFFQYPRSNWQDFGGYNEHEGDWEGVTIFFAMVKNDRNEYFIAPARLALAQHLDGWGVGGGVSVAWEDVILGSTSFGKSGLCWPWWSRFVSLS